MRDEKARPPLQQLDGPVNASDVDADHGEDHGGKQGHNGALVMMQDMGTGYAAHEIDRTDDKEGDGGHLEDDTGDHDVGTCRGVAVDLIGCDRSHAAASGLDDKGDDVAGAEDPEIELWAEEGRFPAKDLDEAAKEDVDACCEEGGGDNES